MKVWLIASLAVMAGGMMALEMRRPAAARSSAFDLSASEAERMAAAGELILIDIRTPEEWRQTGVPAGAKRGNLHHPGGAQGFGDAVLAQVGGDRQAPIGLICRSGNRSTQALKLLKSQGFTRLFNVREGMAGSGAGPGWLKRGLPVVPCNG